jgi:SH3 domain protein
MTANTKYLILGLACLFIGFPVNAEDAWISDQFEVMLRTGPSTTNAIERMLPSGTALEIVERDDETGYTRVRTAGGTEGWVLSRYLMVEASAREQLQRLTSQLTNANAEGSSLSSQLDAVRGEQESANARVATLEREKRQLEQELAEIKRTAANALSIDGQNKALRDELATTEIEAASLEQQNRELTSQTTRYWFMTGALVLTIGIGLGLWAPKIRLQKRSRYDRF